MGRFSLTTVLVAWATIGSITDGAVVQGPPATPSSSPSASSANSQTEPKVEPKQYLIAAAKLFNGDPIDGFTAEDQRMEYAAQYLKAAYMYREQLSLANQEMLKQYLEAYHTVTGTRLVAVAPSPASTGAATTTTPPVPGSTPSQTGLVAAATDLMVQARAALAQGQLDLASELANRAEATGVAFDPNGDHPDLLKREIFLAQQGQGAPRGTADGKQQARWMLQQAQDAIKLGQYDQAETYIKQAEAMNVSWSLFDTTPKQVAKKLEKARPHPEGSSSVRDHKAAKNALKQAEALLEQGHYDQAFTIAKEVESWGLHYSMWETSPEKVIRAASQMRLQAYRRTTPSTEQPSLELYNALVQQARGNLTEGQLEQAESQARKALGMGVIPPITADRAEDVLHDLEMARVQSDAGAGQVEPGVIRTSATQEEIQADQLQRQGDELLSQGRYDEAAASYQQAEQVTQSAEENFEAVDNGQPLEIPSFPMDLENPVGRAQVGTTVPASDLLGQARELYAQGNFPAAREWAQRARDEMPESREEVVGLIQQIDLAQNESVLTLYDAALQALRTQQIDRARTLLNEIAAAPVTNEEMLQKVQGLLMSLPESGERVDDLQVIDQTRTVAAQQLNAEVGSTIAEARRKAKVDPDEALQMLDRQIAIVETTTGQDPAWIRTQSRRLEVARNLVEQDKVQFDRQMQDVNFREEIEQKRLAILEADRQKAADVKRLMDQALEAQENGDYTEAEVLAQRAQTIDPNNESAAALISYVRLEQGYEASLRIREEGDKSFNDALLEVDELRIVNNAASRNGISYPEDWADLVSSRRNPDAPEPDSASVRQIKRTLEQPMPFNFDGESLTEFVNYIRTYTGLQIHLDRIALADEGLDGNTPVHLVMTEPGIKLENALKLVLKPLGLTYYIQDEVLMITSPQANLSTRIPDVYDVTDLVISSKERLRRMQQASANMMSGGTLGNQTGPADVQFDAPNASSSASVYNDEVDMMPLVSVITNSIAPGTWKVVMPGEDPSSPLPSYGLAGGAGGGLGGDQGLGTNIITPYLLNLSLIIRAQPDIHEEVRDLLSQLRRLQDLQVSIEVRFIALTDDFFEQIGVDFDFNIQADVAGPLNAFAITNPDAAPFVPGIDAAIDGNEPFLVNPSRDHSLGGRQPVIVGANGFGDTGFTRITQDLGIPFTQNSFGTALDTSALENGGTFGISFLSDLETYLFIQAAQGDTRANVVQAPRITTLNGGLATFFDVIQNNFVQNQIANTNFGSVAFTPQIGTVPDGAQLSVTPVVSYDRRYVRLSLSPFFSVLNGFDIFTTTAATGGTGLGGGAAAITASFQVPNITTTNIATTVTVPDGGTVLLGGIKRLSETRNEFGVPIFSKLPFVNRLFRNIGISRETSSIMLMVTPRIIILEEEEAKLGIPPRVTTSF